MVPRTTGEKFSVPSVGGKILGSADHQTHCDEAVQSRMAREECPETMGEVSL